MSRADSLTMMEANLDWIRGQIRAIRVQKSWAVLGAPRCRRPSLMQSTTRLQSTRQSTAQRMRASLRLSASFLLTVACSPNASRSASTVQTAPARSGGDATEQRFVDSVLKLMTVEEKLGQLNQLSGVGDPTGPGGAAAGIERIRRGEIGSFLNVVGADTTRKLQRIAVEESRLHIPILFG